MWEIKYYQSPDGSYPVKEFIDSLNVKAKAKVARTIDLLEEFGIDLGIRLNDYMSQRRQIG